MDAKVLLEIGDKEYTGWTAVDISRSLKDVSSSFSLTTTDRAFGDVAITSGQSCKIKYSGELVMTGIIDSFSVSYSSSTHIINVSGRSLTKDLVDSSVESHADVSANKDPVELASTLVKPFGITVTSTNLDSSKLKKYPGAFKLDIGSSVYEIIHQIAEIRQFSVSDNEKGELVLARYDSNSPKSDNALVHRLTKQSENNILSGKYEDKEQDCFHKIIVRGQRKGSDTSFGKSVSNQQAEAIDKNILRAARVLVISSERESSMEDMQELANWEVSRRRGERETWSYTVQGWRQKSLWKVGTLVSVEDDFIYPKPTTPNLLISEINYRMSDSGTTTELQLVPVETYSYKPTTEKEFKEKKQVKRLSKTIKKELDNDS